MPIGSNSVGGKKVSQVIVSQSGSITTQTGSNQINFSFIKDENGKITTIINNTTGKSIDISNINT